MRLLRQPITMPVGASPVSAPTNLGSEKLVGIYLQEVGTGLTKLVVQHLISGNEDDPVASQVWSDVSIAVENQIPATGYTFEPLGIAGAEIVDGATVIFPRGLTGYPLPVIRLRGEGTLATNNAIFRFISDPHS